MDSIRRFSWRSALHALRYIQLGAHTLELVHYFSEVSLAIQLPALFGDTFLLYFPPLLKISVFSLILTQRRGKFRFADASDEEHERLPEWASHIRSPESVKRCSSWEVLALLSRHHRLWW